MPFLDVPSSNSSSSSLLLDGNKLAAGRPKLDEDVLCPPISFPGQGGSKLNTQTLTPSASFVLKSVLAEPASIYIASENASTTFGASQKIFINVCHHEAVPEPSSSTSKSTKGEVSAKQDMSDEAWIPGVASDMAVTLDRAGAPSLLVDVIMASTVHRRLKSDQAYKQIVIQFALERVEKKFSIKLARDYSTPKTLQSKGPLVARSVILPAPRLAAPRVTLAPPLTEKRTLATPNSSESSSNLGLPRLRTSFELSKPSDRSAGMTDTTRSFTFRIYLPSTLRPTPTEPAPRTTLEFLAPDQFSFTVHATCGVTLNVMKEVGRLDDSIGRLCRVNASSVEAEWIVSEGILLISGLLEE
ncbi:Uncharacterized conserved protein [Phaffia rhodozyma]|uniref:Uncharacterized conserved protein n=1 Tax=Phaffia rhodozyma TaxID=264483 RepID=A0A0F7SXP0_PHARH|nr:Uncharacterized conserved protein [Phaffia rhodozyma]